MKYSREAHSSKMLLGTGASRPEEDPAGGLQGRPRLRVRTAPGPLGRGLSALERTGRSHECFLSLGILSALRHGRNTVTAHALWGNRVCMFSARLWPTLSCWRVVSDSEVTSPEKERHCWALPDSSWRPRPQPSYHGPSGPGLKARRCTEETGHKAVVHLATSLRP